MPRFTRGTSVQIGLHVTKDSPKSRAVSHARIGIVEVHLVKEVKELQTELNPVTFLEGKVHSSVQPG